LETYLLASHGFICDGSLSSVSRNTVLGFLSVLNFHFYLLNFMRCLSRNTGYFVGVGGGGGGLHSDVSSWTERRPCFRNCQFAPWLYFLTIASKFLTDLKLAKICSRTFIITETMHTKFIFAFTKTISVLKLIYGILG
jgi:hypothetical protein